MCAQTLKGFNVISALFGQEALVRNITPEKVNFNNKKSFRGRLALTRNKRSTGVQMISVSFFRLCVLPFELTENVIKNKYCPQSIYVVKFGSGWSFLKIIHIAKTEFYIFYYLITESNIESIVIEYRRGLLDGLPKLKKDFIIQDKTECMA